MTKRLFLVAVIAMAQLAPAHAQPQPDQPTPDEPKQPPPDPPKPDPDPKPTPPPLPADTDHREPIREVNTTAAAVAGAPKSDEASGTIEPIYEGPSLLRRIGRGLLFVPRWASWIAFSPIRGGLWLFNRFQIGDQANRIFFNDEGTIGVFPVAFVETGFGLNIGARFIYRELFGKKGKLSARLSYGGQYGQFYTAKLTSGKLIENAELSIEGAYQIFPRSRFFGIGNQDDFSAPGAMPISAFAQNEDQEVAIRTRYRHDDYRFKVGSKIDLGHDFSVKLSGAYRHRKFDDNADLREGDVQIEAAYDTMTLVGYDQGLSNIYPEIELIWDSRRPASSYISIANAGSGTKIAAHLGYAKGFGDDPSSYYRYGLDIQHHINILGGDRYLILRGFGEAVSADIDEIPFVDLPKLGGTTLLRGYDRDRFRDRIAAVATVEYNYPLTGILSAYVFTDLGRVYRNFDAITAKSLEDFHCGFGGGLQIASLKSFVARVSAFSSTNGGFFFTFSFDPVFDSRSKEETP